LKSLIIRTGGSVANSKLQIDTAGDQTDEKVETAVKISSLSELSRNDIDCKLT